MKRVLDVVLFFIVLFLLCVSCAETEIDDNVRVLITGQVVDNENIPLTNVKIEIFTDANFAGTNRILIGTGTSNQEGNFNITSLFGNNQLFYIQISAGNDYAIYQYQTDTSEYTPNNLLFELGTVVLRRLATFNYNIIQTSSDTATLDYSFRYLETNCFEYYNEGVLDNILTECYGVRQFSSQLNSLNPNVDEAITVPLNSQIEYIYTLNNNNQISEIIDVNTTEYEFQFNY